MWRIFKRVLLAALIAGAAVLGFVAVDQGYAPPRGELRNGAIAAVLGLLAGLGVARWRRIDWNQFAAALRCLRKSVFDMVSWAALACASIVVLLYY